MELNAYDLLVLHKNVNRKVGDEMLNNFYLNECNVDIIKSINKLIKKNVLIKDNTLEAGLKKITNKKLTELLKATGLKIGGNKEELVKRIINNVEDIYEFNNNLEIPSVYKTTEKGEQLLSETEYIRHFRNGEITLPRAHEITKDFLANSKDDKVLGIYSIEIDRLYKIDPLQHTLEMIYERLGDYYKRSKQDNNNARLYYNLAYCIQLKNALDDLNDPIHVYYDWEGNFDDDRLKNRISHDRIYEMEQIYEQMIFIEGMSIESIHKLFLEDIKNYYELDTELSKYLMEYIVYDIKKDIENKKLAFTKILNFIDYKELIDKKAVEEYYNEKYEYDYIEDNESETNIIFKTNISNLINKNIDIEVEIDKDSGELYFYLGENDVKSLMEDEV